MAASGFRTLHVTVPRAYAIAWPAYGAGVLAVYTHVGLVGERALGVLTSPGRAEGRQTHARA